MRRLCFNNGQSLVKANPNLSHKSHKKHKLWHYTNVLNVGT